MHVTGIFETQKEKKKAKRDNTICNLIWRFYYIDFLVTKFYGTF